jgi:hypothetical protein
MMMAGWSDARRKAVDSQKSFRFMAARISLAMGMPQPKPNENDIFANGKGR